jgi:hypothetical protein
MLDNVKSRCSIFDVFKNEAHETKTPSGHIVSVMGEELRG